MKMPNMRLAENQANASALIGALGLASLVVLCAVVLKNFNRETYTILYSDVSTLGRYRKILVFIFTAITGMLGMAAMFIGFKTLGHKRNSKQGRSFLGLAAGGIALALAPALLTLWIQRSEAVITKAD